MLRIVVHSELLAALATPAEILATTGAKRRLAAGRSELAFKKSEMKTGKIRWTRWWTCALQRQVLFMKKVLSLKAKHRWKMLTKRHHSGLTSASASA